MISNESKADWGKSVVETELERRGASVSVIKDFRGKKLLQVTGPNKPTITIRVKSRMSGTWQASTNEGKLCPENKDEKSFWILVNLENEEKPEFYIMPDWWIRTDIYNAHQGYLARHGGKRAITQETTHHAIALERIRSWHGQWEILGIF